MERNARGPLDGNLLPRRPLQRKKLPRLGYREFVETYISLSFLITY